VVKLPGPGGSEGGPVPDYAAHVFVSFGSICRLYKLTHSDLAQVTLQLGLSFRLSAKVFGLSALAGRGGGVANSAALPRN